MFCRIYSNIFFIIYTDIILHSIILPSNSTFLNLNFLSPSGSFAEMNSDS